jgi:hypothetical protein
MDTRHLSIALVRPTDHAAVNATIAALTQWFRGLKQQHSAAAPVPAVFESLSQRAAEVYNFSSAHVETLPAEQFASLRALACNMLAAAFTYAHQKDRTAEDFALLFKFHAMAGRAFKTLSQATATKFFESAIGHWNEGVRTFPEHFARQPLLQMLFDVRSDELEMCLATSLVSDEAFAAADALTALLALNALAHARLEFSRRAYNTAVKCLKNSLFEGAIRWIKTSLGTIPVRAERKCTCEFK